MEFVQLLISGSALGCIYALIALGFVLIYKATETVNFAQGELMMLGACTGYLLMAWFKLPFFWAALVSVAGMGASGSCSNVRSSGRFWASRNSPWSCSPSGSATSRAAW